MSTHNTKHLYDLDKDALVALLLRVVTDEVVTEPIEKAKKDHLAACGSTRTLSGKPCGTVTIGGTDCGRHEADDDALARKRADSESFVTKRREYAAKAKAKGPKIDNKALAAELRAVGVTPNGEAWGIAKAHVIEDGMSLADAAAKIAPDYAG